MPTPHNVTLNRIRFVCNDSDRKGIHIKSTIDDTYRLDGKTDEAIAFTDDDVIVIQNKLERACEILLETIRLPDGRRAIFHPSRRAHFMLVDKEVSAVRSERELLLGPGESMTLVTDRWVPSTARGAVFPV
jgi:hypothetical protein